MTVSKHRRLSTLEHRLGSRPNKAEIKKSTEELRWAAELMLSNRRPHRDGHQERGESTLQWQARVLGFTEKEWRAKIKAHGKSLECLLSHDRLFQISFIVKKRKDAAEADLKPREAQRLNREYGFISKLLSALGATDHYDEERMLPEPDENWEDWERRVLGFTRGQWDKERKQAAPEGLLSFGLELLALALCNPDDGVNILAGDLEERLGGESGHDN
tara:strand:- start:96 stop:746 length:651 start_codon:yes stop_codon:yes gene_type:complete